MSAERTVSLAEFFAEYGEAAAGTIVGRFPPRYDREAARRHAPAIRRLRRRPLGAQRHAIGALADALSDAPFALLVGEMGVGKTMVAAAAAWAAGHRRSLVLCPTHLVQKWQREVEATVPGARAVILRDAAAVAAFGRLCRAAPAAAPLYGIISKETAKLGAAWRPAYREREVAYRDEERGLTLRLRAATCPDCGATVVDKEGVPLPAGRLAAKRHFCRACRGALWSYGDPDRARGFGSAVAPRDRFAHWSERIAAVALVQGWAGEAARPRRWRWHRPGLPCTLPPATRQGGHRWPLAATIERELTGLIDVFIADEAHKFKAKGSAQGQAYAALARTARHTLAATGTLLGGYASTIFYVLQRADPAMRAEFGFHEEERWISRYGIWEEVRKKARRDVEVLADGAQSDRKEYSSVTVRERPGIHPALLLRLLPRAVFVRLADVAPDLPPYREYPVLVDMAPEQRAMYLSLERQLREALMAALHAGSKRLLGAYLQTLLSWPDNPRPEAVADGEAGAIAASVDGLPTDRVYPKEVYLLDLADDARRRGRRLLVYCTHTGSRDLTARLARLLTERGHRVATLRAESVPAERREAWVEARVAEGIGVLIANPRCVETGLDLIAFESIVWTELDYSSYVLRQASRRSWRIGQESSVEVHYLCYAETLQASALALMQAKIRASLLLEGELPEGGFTGDVDDDLFAQLARQLSSGAPGGFAGLFADTHEAELRADAFLDAAFLGEDEPDAAALALVPAGEASHSATWMDDAIDDRWPQGAAGGRTRVAATNSLPEIGSPDMATAPPRPGQLSLFAASANSDAGARDTAAATTTGHSAADVGDEAASVPAGPDSGRRAVSWEELAALALAERGRRRLRSHSASPSPHTTRLPLA